MINKEERRVVLVGSTETDSGEPVNVWCEIEDIEETEEEEAFVKVHHLYYLVDSKSCEGEELCSDEVNEPWLKPTTRPIKDTLVSTGSKLLKSGCTIKEVSLPPVIEGVKANYVHNYNGDFLGLSYMKVKRLTFSGVNQMPHRIFSNLDIETVVWPDSCPVIPEECFAFSNIGKVEFENPDEIQKISAKAFFNTKIEEFEWPRSCLSIPLACFFGSSIKKLTGCESVQVVGPSAFEQTELEELPEFTSLQIAESGAFKDTAIRTASISASYLGNGCFMGCKNLEEATITAPSVELKNYVFFENPELKNVRINANVLTLSSSSLVGSDVNDNLMANLDISDIEKLVVYGSKEDVSSILHPSFECEVSYIE